mgnify:CR=1 FL=1
MWVLQRLLDLCDLAVLPVRSVVGVLSDAVPYP